jgi:hypothetical protein
MMSEPKSRSGKKPKYQIADIGGADLTTEDISTERVLNFFIKGETGLVEQSDALGPGITEDQAVVSPTAIPSSDPSTHSSAQIEAASSELSVKKSLSHLFERANSGSGRAKDLKLKLSEPEPTELVSSPPLTVPEQTVATENVIEVESLEVSHRVEVSLPLSDSVSERASKASSKSSSQPPPSNTFEPTSSEEALLPEALPVPTVETGTELSQYVHLWKNFFRLKSGEIDALSAMYRMSYDEGRSECYIKMRKLAEMSNLEYRYCQKVVRSLERLGWITKLQDYDPITQLGVLYRVNLKPTQLM